MKLDLDLVRQLLLELEEAPAPTSDLADYHPRSQYHFERMNEAGLVTIKRDEKFYFKKLQDEENGKVETVRTRSQGVVSMTWQGHEYLEAMRGDGLWEQTKSAISETGGSATMEIAKALALGFLKKKISQHTGIEL